MDSGTIRRRDAPPRIPSGASADEGEEGAEGSVGRCEKGIAERREMRGKGEERRERER